MITLGEEKLGEFLGITASGPRIMVSPSPLLVGVNMKLWPCYLGKELMKVIEMKTHFLSTVSPIGLMCWLRERSSIFPLEEDICMSYKWTAYCFYMLYLH